MTETRTLSARHETVHEGILAGPNATLQEMIDSGLAWRLEGHVGRAAMNALKIGAVVLPAVEHTDAYGNPVPSCEDILDEIRCTPVRSPTPSTTRRPSASGMGRWTMTMRRPGDVHVALGLSMHHEPFMIHCRAASICPAGKCLISADTKCDVKCSATSPMWESVTTPILFMRL